PPAEFVRVLRDARQEAHDVIVVLLSSALSGTWQSGMAAIRAAQLDRVHVVDSRSASLGVGMLALKAAELGAAAMPAPDIVAELERIRERPGVILTVDRYDNLIRSGRVSRGKAWVGPLDRVRVRDNLVPRVLALLERRLRPRPRAVRVGVVHADAPDVAERVRTALVAAYEPRDCFISLATGVLGTHVGPGAWAI